MPMAARVGDPTAHAGALGPPGVPTVLIGGRPAAVVGGTHLCAVPGPPPHPPTPLIGPGVTTVLIGSRPAAVVGDAAGCGATVVMGCPTVMIGG